MADDNQTQKQEESKVAEVTEGSKGEEKTSDTSDSSETSETSQKVPKQTVDLSANAQKIVDEVGKLSVLELSQLVKALEEKFGVSAAPATMAAAPATAAGGDEGASEQTTFNVMLTDSGANKISVIKVVRELVPTLGLKEAKDLVDAPPKQVLEGVNKENANEAKTKLEAAGAKVELK